MPYYSIYGLTLHSNRELPGLVVSATTTASQLVLELGAIPEAITRFEKIEPAWYISDNQAEDEDPNLSVWQLSEKDYFWLTYSDGIEFVLSATHPQLWARWPDHESLESAATYLLGPVLGFWLRLRGVACLHASAVAIEGQAVLFLGTSGAGKSTTAAALAQLGYPVLSDDLTALTEQGDGFVVQPGYSGLRLWSDSAQTLFDSAEALPRLVPAHLDWDKRYLDLRQPGYRFQSEPLPLGAIYLLDERGSEPSRPSIQAVAPRDGLLSLIANTYASYLLPKTRRGQEFEILARLIQQIPLRQLLPHADPARLSQLCDTILTDFCSTVLVAWSSQRFKPDVYRANTINSKFKIQNSKLTHV